MLYQKKHKKSVLKYGYSWNNDIPVFEEEFDEESEDELEELRERSKG